VGWFRKKRARPWDVPPIPAPTDYPELIKDAGACMTTLHVMNGEGRIRFMTRSGKRHAAADNGWQIFSELDTDDYLAVTANSTIADFNQLCAVEPALIGIWDLPDGSDLEIVRDDRIRIFDVTTGLEVPEEALFVPEQFRS
jgi:hypothetical protein